MSGTATRGPVAGDVDFLVGAWDVTDRRRRESGRSVDFRRTGPVCA